jgi:hypothetical protein
MNFLGQCVGSVQSLISMCFQKPVVEKWDDDAQSLANLAEKLAKLGFTKTNSNSAKINCDVEDQLEKEAEESYNAEFITPIFGIGEMFPSDLKLFTARLEYASDMRSKLYRNTFNENTYEWSGTIGDADRFVTHIAARMCRYDLLMKEQETKELSPHLKAAIPRMKKQSKEEFELAKCMVKIMNSEERKQFAALQERNINATTVDELITKKSAELGNRKQQCKVIFLPTEEILTKPKEDYNQDMYD